MRDTQPERMLELAIKGMLPKGRLGRATGKNYLYMLEQNIHMQHKTRSLRTSRIIKREVTRYDSTILRNWSS